MSRGHVVTFDTISKIAYYMLRNDWEAYQAFAFLQKDQTIQFVIARRPAGRRSNLVPNRKYGIAALFAGWTKSSQ